MITLDKLTQQQCEDFIRSIKRNEQNTEHDQILQDCIKFCFRIARSALGKGTFSIRKNNKKYPQYIHERLLKEEDLNHFANDIAQEAVIKFVKKYRGDAELDCKSGSLNRVLASFVYNLLARENTKIIREYKYCKVKIRWADVESVLEPSEEQSEGFGFQPLEFLESVILEALRVDVEFAVEKERDGIRLIEHCLDSMTEMEIKFFEAWYGRFLKLLDSEEDKQGCKKGRDVKTPVGLPKIPQGQLSAIAEELGISNSRINQLKSAVLGKLRKCLYPIILERRFPGLAPLLDVIDYSVGVFYLEGIHSENLRNGCFKSIEKAIKTPADRLSAEIAANLHERANAGIQDRIAPTALNELDENGMRALILALCAGKPVVLNSRDRMAQIGS